MKQISLIELSDNFYDDLNGELTAVQVVDNEELLFRFNCDNWNDTSHRLKFKITCKDIAESNLSPRPVAELCLRDDHVLLWAYNHKHVQLFYNSIPKDPFRVLGLLWGAHQRNTYPYSGKYSLIGTQNFVEHSQDGFGLLARGPEPLINAYYDAISDEVELNVVDSYEPIGGYSCLEFDEVYVIAKSFKVTCE